MAYTAYNPLVITIDNAAAGAVSATLTRGVQVIDAIGYVTTPAVVDTKFQVSSASGNISDLIELGNNADGKIGRAGQIDDDNAKLGPGDDVTSTLTGAGTACRATIICVDTTS